MKHLESCFNLKTVVRHFSDSSVNIYDIFHLRSIIIIFQKFYNEELLTNCSKPVM